MILITGATGFLGRYLVDEFLSQGYDLRLLVRDAANRTLPWGSLVEVFEGDVRDVMSLEKAMEGVDAVVHAAAIVSFNPRRREEMKQINVEGTAHVVNLCLEKGVRKLVHMSSVAASGRMGKGEWVDESSQWQAGARHNYYGQTKRQAELEVARGLAEGLGAVMLNPAIILGPGDWNAGTPKLFNLLSRGFPVYNNGVSGYVSAKDVALATRLAYESDFEQGERFLLAAENIDQKTLFAKISEAFGQKAPALLFPPFLAPVLGFFAERWAFLQGKEPLISRETARSSTEKTYYNGQKVVDELGLSYTPIDEVIRETVAAFQKEKNAKQ